MTETEVELDAGRRPGDRLLRWAELILLFVGAPLAMAYLMDPGDFRTALLAIAVVGISLLALTREFRWRSLFEGKVLAHWPIILVFFVGCCVFIGGTVWIERPWAFFDFPQNNTNIWLFVMVAYPIFLVTPQELVFRALFFNRYGHLFGNKWVAIFVNSLLFGLAHLFYWNWPAVVLTFIGNFLIAYAYVEKRSFPLAWTLHAISGQLVFTIGLGTYFYHGAIPG